MLNVNHLGSVAGRTNPVSEADFADLCIEFQEIEKQPGWDIWMRYLEKLREITEIPAQLDNHADF
jgi:hypothetical protein